MGMKQKRVMIGMVVAMFLGICVCGIKYYNFLNGTSGAANNDLRKGLSTLEGEEYQAVLKANEMIRDTEVLIYEEMTFAFERTSLKKWNESMPTADAEGTLFDTSNKICTYSCVAEICRYAVINGERVSDSETCKVIKYTGYEDVGENSKARAVIDNASRKVSYSHGEEYFDDFQKQAEAACEFTEQEQSPDGSFQPPIEGVQWGMTPEEMQERYRYVQVEVPARNSQPDDFSQEAQWDVLKSQALVTVTFGNNILNYDAGHMAAYENLYNDEKVYEEFLNSIE